jgi:hypothetical protein
MTFKQGQSGNPKGRPKGVIDKRTKLRDYLEPHAKDLIQKTVELALSGEINALRLCLERLLPKARHEAVDINLPDNDMTQAQAIMQAGSTILQAVANGEMPPEQGKMFAAMLEQQRKAIETADLAMRLEELERLTAEK